MDVATNPGTSTFDVAGNDPVISKKSTAPGATTAAAAAVSAVELIEPASSGAASPADVVLPQHHVNDDPLTVCKPSKIETELPREIEASLGPSASIILVRYLAMFFIAAAFLACLVTSKMAVLAMGFSLRKSTVLVNHTVHDRHDNSSGVFEVTYGAESTFLWLLFAILVPHACTLMQSVWLGGCRADRLWPSWWALSWGVAASLLESAGVVLFVFEVLPQSKNYTVVWIMNVVFFFPILSQIISDFRICSTEGKRWKIILLILAFVFELVGAVCLIVGKLQQKDVHSYTKKEIYITPLSLFLLSIAWSHVIQRQQQHSRPGQLAEQVRRIRERNENSGLDETDPNIVFTQPELSARWKISAITSILKLFLITGFSFLYVGYIQTGTVNFSHLHAGFLNLNLNHPVFRWFMANIFCSFGGYVLGVVACIVCMQKPSFAIPLILCTPISCLVVILEDSCRWQIWKEDCEHVPKKELMLLIPSALCLVAAQICSTAIFIYKTQTIVMQKTSHLFWLPGYNGIFLEQLLLLGRKNIQTDRQHSDSLERARNTHLIICTTMYREAAHEMEQLLRSIRAINRAKQIEDRNIESHIFFDNGCRGSKLTDFALQLVCIAKDVFGVTSMQCTKVKTPYGISLTWRLPTVIGEKRGMDFVIHLKDNQKVKSKKRWSQIMYMSYVLDYYIKEANCATKDNTFILTTDADVMFTPESVEALLDLMVRDSSVGAVCSRTFPMGSGPVYWYQIFDYAIGHWLQKASNHVLGSVLCCPGCFSVYRVKALDDIVPTYGSHVEKASEFLTKDMGEDRWLCTLMVQSGWRLEYCAAAENSTYCPEEFDEFFKQRRRWIPSTLANLVLLLQEWKTMTFFNKRISFGFMLYQALLLFSSLINPAVSILIMVGGLYYAWGWNQLGTTILLILITLVYTLICLYCSQETQLMAAKILTVVFAMLMAAVIVGTAVQIVQDNTKHEEDYDDVTTSAPHPTHHVNGTFLDEPKNLLSSGRTSPKPQGLHVDLPVSTTTMYLTGMVLIFVVSALMHLPEAYCLLHGVWYLLCLPAGNLLLMIYSVCNMTDRSWGTREEKKVGDFGKTETWAEKTTSLFKRIFFCINFNKKNSVEKNNKSVQTDKQDHGQQPSDTDETDGARKTEKIRTARVRQGQQKTNLFRFGSICYSRPNNVREWLPQNLRDQYIDIFETNGFDDTSFIAQMTDKELSEIGVKTKAHRNALKEAIRLLPEPEIQCCVPGNVDEWLDSIGLSRYAQNFHRAHIITPSNMEVLKTMSFDDIRTELDIKKLGHLKRIQLAIQKLRYPTPTERAAFATKYELEALHMYKLEEHNVPLFEFWEKLRKERLLPDLVAFAHDIDLKVKLTELRNSTLLVFAIANTLWLIFILSLLTKSQLNILDTNALGLAFLILFGFVVVIQFICMVFHRLSTWMHLIARAPSKLGGSYNSSWAFNDKNIHSGTMPRNRNADGYEEFDDTDDVEARRARDSMNEKYEGRFMEGVESRVFSGESGTERRRPRGRRPLLTVLSRPTTNAEFGSTDSLVV